jgi:hypothetical protein
LLERPAAQPLRRIVDDPAQLLANFSVDRLDENIAKHPHGETYRNALELGQLRLQSVA